MAHDRHHRPGLLQGLIPVLALALTACASTPPPVPPMADRYPQVPTAPPPSDGSLFDLNRAEGLFGDRRARRPGDMLTVILSERTLARKSATTNTTKSNSVGLAAPTLFGRTPAPDPASVDISAEREFEGSGDSAQSNQLEGRLTVFVTEVLAGGALRITGEKRLQLSQGVESLELTGIVRPDDIAPDNTIPSHRIAQAHISYAGRGAIDDANTMGWLARFFNSPLWPF